MVREGQGFGRAKKSGLRRLRQWPMSKAFPTIRMTTPPRNLQLRFFRQGQSAILDTIEQLVTLESPSDVKAAVDRVGTVLASRFEQLGGKVRIHPEEKFGNHLQVDFQGESGQKPFLLLGHMDTVYPVGTILKMPFRSSKGRAWGPGVFDMKAGIALALHVLEALLGWNNGFRPPDL